MRVAAVVALLVTLTGAKAPPEPVKLAPIAQWKVDYSAKSCILTRDFTSGRDAYQFELTLAPVEKRAWLRLGTGEMMRGHDSGNAAVEVDGSRLKEPTHFNIFPNVRNGTTREFLFNQFQRDIGRVTRSLRLTPAGHGDFQLDVPDFPDAMRVMASCMADLHRSLGIDPAALAAVAVEPQGWSMSFVKTPGGPFDIELVYWVAPDGRVDDCRVLAPSGKGDFDTRVCGELRQKGRFKPARNAAGDAIRAPVYEHVRMRVETRTSTSPLALD